MNFATYTADDRQFYGAVTEGGMIALSPDCPGWPTMRDAIAAGGLSELARMARGPRRDPCGRHIPLGYSRAEPRKDHLRRRQLSRPQRGV